MREFVANGSLASAAPLLDVGLAREFAEHVASATAQAISPQ